MSALTRTGTDEPWLLDLGDLCALRSIDEHKPLRGKLFEVDRRTASLLSERGIECSKNYATADIVEALDRVDALLSQVPSLQKRIDFCVKEIVVLQAPSDEYDVSHSEPQWPGRIYTSIPNCSLVQELRVVEAIVHEAMHLNLTLYEQVADVFKYPDKLLYSPWREQARPASGVFHGFFVFRCVERFFRQFVLANENNDERAGFVSRRLDQINIEISQIDMEGLSNCMGIDGRKLLNRLASP